MHSFKFTTVAAAALFFLSAVSAESHAAMARRHMHAHAHKRGEITKRSTCEFPKDAGLVAVTPGEKNAGWAMSPDQPCEPGMSSDRLCTLEKLSSNQPVYRDVLPICLPSRSIDGPMGS